MKLLLICLLMCSAGFADGVGKIVGRVVDENGDAVIGANIWTLEMKQGASVLNPDGRYVILGVVPGTYTVKVSCIGYETQEINDVVVSIDLTTTVNTTLIQIPIQGNGVEIRGKGKGTIEGQVVDENGVGISGAEVLVHTYSGLVHIRAEDPQKVFTDAKGHFISFAYSGTCSIEIKCLGYNKQKIRNIEIHAGDTTTVNVKLVKELRQSEAQIKGVVTGKIAGRVVDENGWLLGANIAVMGTTQGATSSEPEGSYAILGLNPGLYTLKCSSIGYAPVEIPCVHVQGDSTTRIDVKLFELPFGDNPEYISDEDFANRIQKDSLWRVANPQVIIVCGSQVQIPPSYGVICGSIRGADCEVVGQCNFELNGTCIDISIDSLGLWRVGRIRPGMNQVKVEADGFAPFVRDSVAVEAGVDTRLALRLQKN